MLFLNFFRRDLASFKIFLGIVKEQEVTGLKEMDLTADYRRWKWDFRMFLFEFSSGSIRYRETVGETFIWLSVGTFIFYIRLRLIDLAKKDVEKMKGIRYALFPRN